MAATWALLRKDSLSHQRVQSAGPTPLSEARLTKGFLRLRLTPISSGWDQPHNAEVPVKIKELPGN